MFMLQLKSMVSRQRGWLRRAIKNEKGATSIEYALIVTFVALVIIVGVTALGTNLNTWFSNMGSKVGTWASSS
jgi:pilus assembly protein Flp/PilA